MPERITADMLEEFGPTVQGIFRYVYPQGASAEELKNSKHKILRRIYEYVNRKAGDV